MPTPKAVTKVRGFQSVRPIMAILDLLGRRWALRILWELHQYGPNNFRALQKLCGDISPTVLNARLKELREAGIVEQRDAAGYCITNQGVALGKIIVQLNTWAKKWAERPTSVKASRHKKASFPKSNQQNPKA
jgi:DNA-binding HxlR family transcriptional regulator